MQLRRRRVFDGTRLREHRDDQDLTQAELADLADLAPRTIAYIEAGGHEPRLGTIKKLARGLGVKVSDFYIEHPEAEAS